MGSPEEAVHMLTELKEELQRKLELETQKLGSTEVSTRNLEDVNGSKLNVMKNKLELESKLEATTNADLLTLPGQKELLFPLAKEQAQGRVLLNQRTLEYYKGYLNQVKHENYQLAAMLDLFETVDRKVDELEDTEQDEHDYRWLSERFSLLASVFKEVRTELLHYFSTRFSKGKETDSTVMTLLQNLLEKFNSDPNNPYIDVESDVTRSSDIELLIKNNLVTRHPANPLLIRLIDPRRS